MTANGLRVTWLCLEWPREGEHVGGVGRYCQRMAAQLRSLVDLTIVAYAGAQPLEGVRIIELPTPTSRLGRYYVSPARARRAVAESRPDVVHAHGDDWLVGRVCPIVRSFYGSSLGEARSSTGLRKLNHYVLAGTEKVSQARARLRIGIAPESVDQFRCHVIMPPYLPHDGSAPVRAPSHDPTVLFIGSFQGRKQGWLAQRSVEALRASEVPNARLVVVGPRSDASSWASWVDHRAGLSDDAVQEILATAWVLASPSLYEGFGIPMVESLAAGAPVVALRNAGSAYLRSLGDADLPLVIADDAETFELGLAQRLRSGPKLAVDEIRAASSLVDTVTREGSPEHLVDLYREVLA